MFHCEVWRLKKTLRSMPRRVAFVAMVFVALFGPALQVYAGQRVVRVGRLSEVRSIKGVEVLVPSPVVPMPAPSVKMKELAQFLTELHPHADVEATDEGARYGHLTIGNFAPPEEEDKGNAEVSAPLFLDGAFGALSPVGSTWARVNASQGTISSRISMTQDGVHSTLDTTLYMDGAYLYVAGHLTKVDANGDEGAAPLYIGSGGWRSLDGIDWEQIGLGTTAAAAADFYDEADDMISDVSDCPAMSAVACAPAVAVGVVIVVVIVVLCYLFCWLLWYVDATPSWNMREELRRKFDLPLRANLIPLQEGGARC